MRPTRSRWRPSWTGAFRGRQSPRSWQTRSRFTSPRTWLRWRTFCGPTRSPECGPRVQLASVSARRDDSIGRRSERLVLMDDAPGPGVPLAPQSRAAGLGPLLRLVAVVAAGLVLAIAFDALPVLVVVLALVAMIMLHELGHFATAKWSGMKVTEYFLGFGPRLWSIRRGETEYGIKAIPAGGYVKILGMTSAEHVDPADEPRTYRQWPFHNRLLAAVAGSAMHGVMAFVLLWGLFVFIGAPQGNAVAISGFAPLAHGVDPARAAGLQAGDVVKRVNGAS